MRYDRVVRPSRPHLCRKRRKASRLNPSDLCAGLDPSRRAFGEKFTRAMDVNISDGGSEHEHSNGEKSGKTKWIPTVFQSRFFQFTRKNLMGIHPAPVSFSWWAASIFLSKNSEESCQLSGRKPCGSFSIHLSGVCLFPVNSTPRFLIIFLRLLPQRSPPALDNRMGVVSQLDILPKGWPFGNPKAGTSRRFASRTPKGGKT